MVTIVLFVSRKDYLHKLFVCLEMLDCKASETNLLVVVDGDDELFVHTRNKVEETKFNQRLTVHYKDGDKMRNYSKAHRRMRIAKLNNYAKQFIQDCRFVMGIEDDTYFPANTLKKLLKDYETYSYAGIIEGVEVGRWGIPIIGAWRCDDVYNPTRFESVLPSKQYSIEPIDAGGLYCYLTKRDNYERHDFTDFKQYGLGPDVGYGIALRKQGLKNYVDWSINCEHDTPEGVLNYKKLDTRQVVYNRTEKGWR